MICFESVFGYQIRPLVRDGAEVIVVSTNNRSYRRSANSAQHLAIGQIRAAETGRPVVQAAISGISALIDASGREHARTELFERTVLQGSVEATRGSTLYVRFGDWVVLGSLLALAGCGIAHVVTRRRTSVDSVGPSRGRAAGPGTGRRSCMNHDETPPERRPSENGTSDPGRATHPHGRCTCSCTHRSVRVCRWSKRYRRSSKRSRRAGKAEVDRRHEQVSHQASNAVEHGPFRVDVRTAEGAQASGAAGRVTTRRGRVPGADARDPSPPPRDPRRSPPPHPPPSRNRRPRNAGTPPHLHCRPACPRPRRRTVHARGGRTGRAADSRATTRSRRRRSSSGSPGLADAELAAVRNYEATHRNRRTILGKIEQLESPSV